MHSRKTTNVKCINCDGSVLHMSGAVSNSDAFIQQMTIAPNAKVTINITDVSSSTSFIIAQVHVYQYNVTLSYDEDFPHIISNRTVYGSNIGLYVKPNSTVTQLYLKNRNNRELQGIAVAIFYDHKAPVPGGCNMEFDHAIAPYTKVQLQDTIVTVDSQPASVPFSEHPNCDKNPVEHEMYQMYLSERDFSPESYFQGIISMLTVSDIMDNGYQVSYRKLTSPMRRIYSRYTGIGSVYATVATYGNKSAAYVPTFSYACSPAQDPDSCEVLTDSFPKFVCALCFFVGLIGLLSGHLVYAIDQFVGFLFVGTMIGHMITGSIGYGSLIGFGAAAVFCRIPYSSSVNVGWFFACLIFFLSPETISILHSNWVFLLSFIVTVILISIVVALTGPIICALITGIIYSSFMIVLPLDYWFGSSLKYILINPTRRATDAQFCDAIILQPTQGKDIFLICLWVILALIRLTNCSRLITSYVPL
ncbi:transmembrane 7 superfamily member 3 isoform X2 [Lasioglossum baleicum]|uniref:transmembrane 7 superfamily member 3 isoform X2 n=1 Tax=Lasioglossum baleicum TaxID=434251 RepID=UPI003FCE09E9